MSRSGSALGACRTGRDRLTQVYNKMTDIITDISVLLGKKAASNSYIHKEIKRFCLLTIIILIFFTPSIARAFVSSTELIEKSKQYDLKEVSIQGEIIGDIFIKKDFCWINISDGINAIGIWIPKKMTEQFSHTGDYTHRGDIIQITGRFHRTCSEHIGEIDIHAEDIVFLKKGENISHPVNRARAITALILFFFALVFFVLEMYLERNIKKNGLES